MPFCRYDAHGGNVSQEVMGEDIALPIAIAPATAHNPAQTDKDEHPMGRPHIDVPRESIAEFCRRNRIRRLALFGSALRDDFGPDSDVDVLVEFEPGARIGLQFFDLEQELSEMLGRKVDLNTPGFLSDDVLKDALAEAEVQYDAA